MKYSVRIRREQRQRGRRKSRAERGAPRAPPCHEWYPTCLFDLPDSSHSIRAHEVLSGQILLPVELDHAKMDPGDVEVCWRRIHCRETVRMIRAMPQNSKEVQIEGVGSPRRPILGDGTNLILSDHLQPIKTCLGKRRCGVGWCEEEG